MWDWGTSCPWWESELLMPQMGLTSRSNTAHHFLRHFIGPANFRWWILYLPQRWEAKVIFAEFTFCLVFQTYFIYIKYTFMKLNMNILMSCSCVSLLQAPQRLHHLSPNSLPAPLWAQVPWERLTVEPAYLSPRLEFTRGSSDITQGWLLTLEVRPAGVWLTSASQLLWPWTVCLAFVGFSP